MRNILMQAIQYYGEDNQVIKAIEELSELIVQLAKRQNQQGLRIHLLDELADASIMLNQLCMIFGENEVKGLIEQKVTRLRDRMVEEQSVIEGGI